MINLTPKQEEELRLFENSLGITEDSGELLGESTNPALCASIIREERLQYNFMVLYQVLVLILATAVLLLLLFAIYRLTTGETITALLSGAGAVVSGVAAGFLYRQRKDARDTHKAAQAALEKYKCP